MNIPHTPITIEGSTAELAVDYTMYGLGYTALVLLSPVWLPFAIVGYIGLWLSGKLPEQDIRQ